MTTPLPTLSSAAELAPLAPTRSAAARLVTKVQSPSFRETLADCKPPATDPEGAQITADRPVGRDTTPAADDLDEAAPSPADDQSGTAPQTEPNEQAPEPAPENGSAQPQAGTEPTRDNSPTARPGTFIQPAQQALVTAQGLPEGAPPDQSAQAQPARTGQSGPPPASPASPVSPAPQAPPSIPELPMVEPPAASGERAGQAAAMPQPLIPEAEPMGPQTPTVPVPQTTGGAEKIEPARAPSVPAGSVDEAVSNSKPAGAARPDGTVSSAPQSVMPQAVTPSTVTGGLEADRPQPPDGGTNAAGDRSSARLATGALSEDRSSGPLAPAAARAVQVNAAVQLENIAAELASGEGADRLSARGARPVVMANGASLKADGAGSAAGMLSDVSGESDFSSRIVRGLSAMVSQRGGVMNMRLQPPELGSLRVQMSIIQGTVSAQFTATTEHAQMLLERNLTVLRAALQSNGLTVERLGVQLASGESSSSARHEAGEQQHQQHQQTADHDAAGRESRGRRDGDEPAFHHRRAATAEFAARLGALGDQERPSNPPASFGVRPS